MMSEFPTPWVGTGRTLSLIALSGWSGPARLGPIGATQAGHRGTDHPPRWSRYNETARAPHERRGLFLPDPKKGRRL